MVLRNKKIVICVTGSVAAIQTPRLVRELRRRGASVRCVMSKSAQQIITPDVLEWASDTLTITKLTGQCEHVKLAGLTKTKADLVAVIPATANTISKIASGIDDTPVTTVVTTALGTGIPLILAPAMHLSMYSHQILLENIDKLKLHGVDFIEPNQEEQKAKVLDPIKVANIIEAKLTPKDLEDKRILITAGATREHLDPVRYISNRSSGKMAISLANEAFKRGAHVTLVRAHTEVEPQFGNIWDIEVNNSKEMYEKIKEHINQDIIIHAAAVSDFTLDTKAQKISSKHEQTLGLKPTVKILDHIKRINPKVKLISFKLGAGIDKNELLKQAYLGLKRSKSNLVVANDAAIALGTDYSEVSIVDKEAKTIHLRLQHKKDIANQILDNL